MYEAPAKVNLSLLVHSAAADGMHPIESLVQTIEIVDRLEVSEADEDSFVCSDSELESDDNLVLKALERVRERGTVPPIDITLQKTIPIEAGLGGGSSDGAAATVAALEHGSLDPSLAAEITPQLGADVTLFLTGGTQIATGYGERLEPMAALDSFAVAVVVPDFGLSTPEVYRMWDSLGEPEGAAVDPARLPPVLRDGMPIRNDLTPAAIRVEPRIGDFIADVFDLWGSPVLLSGSGSACFGLFGDVGEARDAVAAVAEARARFGVDLRPHGVKRVDENE